MNWFKNLFKPKKKATEIRVPKSLNGQQLFEKGMEAHISRQTETALNFFDLAIKHDYTKEVYGSRGQCLQELHYHYDAIHDFTLAIKESPKDCNFYYSRSISKAAILDYEGEIEDILKAIELSNLDNELNNHFNDIAKERGYNNVREIFEFDLIHAKNNLEFKITSIERINSATSPDTKSLLQKLFDEGQAKRLALVKKRNSI